MANANISYIQQANTFDDWRIATNNLANGANQLRNSLYYKDAGGMTFGPGASPLTLACTSGTVLIVGADASVANALTAGYIHDTGDILVDGYNAIFDNPSVLMQVANTAQTKNLISNVQIWGQNVNANGYVVFTGANTTGAPSSALLGANVILNIAGNITVANTGTMNIANTAYFTKPTGNGVNVASNTYTGNLMVGLSTGIGANANVFGSINATSTLEVSANANLYSGLTVSANATIGGKANVYGTANVVGTLETTGNTYLYSNLAVSKNTTISQNANVSGTINILSTLEATGNAYLYSNLAVSKNTTISQNANVFGTMGVAGNTFLQSNLFVSSNATVSQNVNVSGTMNVTSVTDLMANANLHSNLTVSWNTATGNASVVQNTSTGNLTVSQNTSSGNLAVTQNTSTGNLVVSTLANIATGNIVTANVATLNVNAVGALLYANVEYVQNAYVQNSNTTNAVISYANVYTQANIFSANILTANINVENVNYINVSSQAALYGPILFGSATIAAAGTNQGSATLISADNTYIGSGTGGVILPAAVLGREISITNSTSSPINLYPASGNSLENLTANAPVVVPGYATVSVVAKSGSNWWFQTPVYNPGTGVYITQAASGTVTFAIGQPVLTTNSVTFANVTVTQNTSTGNLATTQNTSTGNLAVTQNTTLGNLVVTQNTSTGNLSITTLASIANSNTTNANAVAFSATAANIATANIPSFTSPTQAQGGTFGVFNANATFFNLTVANSTTFTGPTLSSSTAYQLRNNLATDGPGYFEINRGTGNGNATLAFACTANVWQATSNDLNPLLTYTLITTQNLSSSTTTVDSYNVATLTAVSYVSANALGAYNKANLAYTAANTGQTTANLAYANANLALTIANSAANTVAVFANGTIVLPNANINFNNTATVNVLAQANGITQSNVTFTVNVSSTDWALGANTTAQSALTLATTANNTANGAYYQANNAIVDASYANANALAAYGQANTATLNASYANANALAAYGQANNAYGQANNFNLVNSTQSGAGGPYYIVGIGTIGSNVSAYSNSGIYFTGNAMNVGQVRQPILVGQSESTNVVGSFAGTYTANLAANTMHSINISSGTLTVAFANPPAAGNTVTFTLFIKQSSSGGSTITWPSTVYWSDSIVPTFTSTANKTDVFTFVTYNGGVSYFGSQVMANVAI